MFAYADLVPCRLLVVNDPLHFHLCDVTQLRVTISLRVRIKVIKESSVQAGRISLARCVPNSQVLYTNSVKRKTKEEKIKENYVFGLPTRLGCKPTFIMSLSFFRV